MRRTFITAAAVGVLIAACSSDPSGTAATTTRVATVGSTTASTAPSTTAPSSTAPSSTAPVTKPADAATDAAVQAAVAGAGERCDPLDTTRCLLPFPSDAYTRADPTSAVTGLRVALPAAGMPMNSKGVTVDVKEWNRNDGFSPNTPLLTYFPKLDAAASKLPGWADIGGSILPDAPIVLVDTTTSTRIPLWAEVDSHAKLDTDRLLTIRPATPLAEGHHFAIGIRHLVDHNGTAYAPSATFRAYRDGLVTTIHSVEGRRADMEQAFAALGHEGANRSDLQLAWTFTTASEGNIAGRMLHIRDDALAALGTAAPAYTITKVTPNSDSNIAVQIQGTYTVPNYLTGDGSPGNRFHYATAAVDALPQVNPAHPTLQSPFLCNISVATMKGHTAAHLVEYGHGLLGGNDEINAGNVRDMSNESNSVYCATKWAGMSEDDIGNAASTLAQFGQFPTMADRLQQGVLNQIFLGRLMTRSGGLADAKVFHRADGSSIVDRAHLFYDGNSQGGIMGLMLAAVSPDIERSVLGVPGMNYSLLLPRSVDFDTYEAIMKPAYPSDLDRTLLFGIVQMLWDRGEGAGYVQHVTSQPYEGTSPGPVLLDVAFGDHQVTPLSAFVEARALHLTIHQPIIAAGRGALDKAAWGLDATTYPSSGSGIIVWDSGVAPMPVENLAPRVGDDSHEDPRADANVRKQKTDFLFQGLLLDLCGAKACTAAHRT